MRSLMNEPLSSSSETLATLGTGVWLGARVYSFMNCLLTCFYKCFGTETTLVWFGVLMHSNMSIIAASATQNFTTDTTFEGFTSNPLCRFCFEPCWTILWISRSCIVCFGSWSPRFSIFKNWRFFLRTLLWTLLLGGGFVRQAR